jgi:hypothetical protein
MQSLGVVEVDDVVGNVALCLAVVSVLALPNALHLQVQKETLAHSVVPTIAFSAHALPQAIGVQQFSVCLAGVLAAPVGVHEQTRLGLTRPNGHTQGITDQRRLHMWGHGPADELAREQIEHHGQVKPAAGGAYVGDVAHPSAIGLLGLELALVSTLSATGSWCLLSVVWVNLRFQRARSPWRRMRARTIGGTTGSKNRLQ